ncbi:hypothetical protein KC363_g5263 [Hortaea werneckii]|nr:hypothetical protein KC363_g5263 [Hortaea werneckii]
MENSPFAKLSAELRNQIYHLVLAHSKPIGISSSRNGDKIWSQIARRRKLLALTRACKAIREESIKIFYAINTFKHLARNNVPRPRELVQNFDTLIGRELAAAIRKVIVEPQVLKLTTSFPDSLGGDKAVIDTAKELIYLALKNDSRTYQLQCNFLCYTEFQDGPPWQRWKEILLFDMPYFVTDCKETRATMRPEIVETDDPAVKACLSKIEKRIAYWQACFMLDLFKQSLSPDPEA